MPFLSLIHIYYVFTPEEINEILGTKQGKAFCRNYGITGPGNFEGKSIPNLLGNEAYESICEERPGAEEEDGRSKSRRDVYKRQR